jgi:hypothetical protein
MIVIKLTDGALWVNSPVLTPNGELDRIKALGPVRYLVAPTQLHLWRLEEWQDFFPDAELWGPPQITKRFQPLSFAGLLREAPPNCWAQDLDQTVLKGNCFVEELAFYHKKSRTLIMTDFIQNHPIPSGQRFNARRFCRDESICPYFWNWNCRTNSRLLVRTKRF